MTTKLNLVQKYNPYRLNHNPFAQMQAFWDDWGFGGNFFDFKTPLESEPKLHNPVVKTDTNYQVEFELPRFKKENLKVNLKHDCLEVHGSQKLANGREIQFSQVHYLGNDIDYNAEIDAKLGPSVERRHALRATLQGEAARTFLASIRTSRAVQL